MKRHNTIKSELGHGPSAFASNDIERIGGAFVAYIKAGYRSRNPTTSREKIADDTFVAAQWSSESAAALAIDKMAVRNITPTGDLADLLRERDDLLPEWHGGERLLTYQSSLPPARRNLEGEARLSARLKFVAARVEAIDQNLQREFPGYALRQSSAVEYSGDPTATPER